MTVPARTTGHETCHHSRYKITCEDFERLLSRASGCCEMCGSPARGQKLEIDHDHILGDMAVRGLVCRECNVRLGRVDGGASVDALAAAYLSQPFFLTLPTFKVLRGPGIHPTVAAEWPEVRVAFSRYGSN